tara:strand:+ start:1848 stop:2048 length:201 start_codon:yes stop_codon:yes gene_type:complete
MENKLGSYIQKLMTVVIDTEEKEFTRRLSFDELQNLHSQIGDFLLKNQFEEEVNEEENKNQQLLFD